MAYFNGALIGLGLATVFGVGPAFFMLIQTSISKGFKTALTLDLGVILSDILVVVLMMMTSIELTFDKGDNMVLAGIAAGLIVIGFGVYTYLSKPEKIVERSEKKTAELAEMDKKFEKLDQQLDKINERLDIKRNKGPRWYVYIAKGFVMNIFNPFIWVFWMTCTATAAGSYDSDNKLISFFIGVFSIILVIDILKIVGAYSLKRFFTENRMKILNQATGIILILCGLILIVRVLFFC